MKLKEIKNAWNYLKNWLKKEIKTSKLLLLKQYYILYLKITIKIGARKISSPYKDSDVPFCCKCTRFMITPQGKVKVVLNRKTDPIYLIREGLTYVCPKCGAMVIYKWLDTYIKNADFIEKTKNWVIFLEEHEHLNYRAGKI